MSTNVHGEHRPRRAQPCLAQSIEEVPSISSVPVSLGPYPGEVEIVDGNWFTILTQLAMALPDEPVQLGPRRVEHSDSSIASRPEPIGGPAMEGAGSLQRLDCVPVLAPRIEGKRVVQMI